MTELNTNDDLLLKLISEKNDEQGAIELLKQEGDRIDINNDLFIFIAIDCGMTELSKAILKHPRFNPKDAIGKFGVPFVEYLMFNVVNTFTCHKNAIRSAKDILDFIFNEFKSWDFNLADLNHNTCLHIACDEERVLEYVKYLVNNKNVNVNAVNDFNETPLTRALISKNIRAVKLLCTRQDLKIRNSERALAKEHLDIDLDALMKQGSVHDLYESEGKCSTLIAKYHLDIDSLNNDPIFSLIAQPLLKL